MQAPRGRPLPRREAFFGLHFDIHASEADLDLWADLSEELAESLIERVRPDYMQWDCKGHPGFASYPTDVGERAPGIAKDALALWREVTRRHGVALYVHYSGLWDEAAVRKHPEWARVDESGRRDPRLVSAFGPYAEELLVPQLREVAARYGVEGVWVDGDCWAVKPDWCEEARRERGAEAPRGPGEPGWREWMEFQRRKYLEYVRRYVDALHEAGLEVGVNWLFSSFSPLPPTVPVDFLTGDVTPMAAVDRLRFEARCMAAMGMPWELMSWGFTWGEGVVHTFKPAVQLMQEAAVVISQGGGFCIYYQPTRRGWIDGWAVDVMERVACFCRERQAVCHKTETVPQVALLLSSRAYFEALDRSASMFQPVGGVYDSIQGLLHALLELHYSVDIVFDWQLPERAERYPLIVVPEWESLGEDVVERLVECASGGRGLLVVGAGTSRLFGDHLGVRFVGEPEELEAYLPGGGVLGWAGGLWQRVEPLSAECVGVRYPSPDTRGGGECAATLSRLGRGLVAAIYGPLGALYCRFHVPVLREFVGSVVGRLVESLVKVRAPPFVDVVLRRRGGDLVVHLVNLAGRQVAAEYVVVDYVPPMGPVEILVKGLRGPVAVRSVPEGLGVEASWGALGLEVRVPRVEVHCAIVLEGCAEEVTPAARLRG